MYLFTTDTQETKADGPPDETTIGECVTAGVA